MIKIRIRKNLQSLNAVQLAEIRFEKTVRLATWKIVNADEEFSLKLENMSELSIASPFLPTTYGFIDRPDSCSMA